MGLYGGGGCQHNQEWMEKHLECSLEGGELIESSRGKVGRLVSWLSFCGVI